MKLKIEKDYLFKEKNSFFVSLFRVFKYKGYKMDDSWYGSFAENKLGVGM